MANKELGGKALAHVKTIPEYLLRMKGNIRSGRSLGLARIAETLAIMKRSEMLEYTKVEFEEEFGKWQGARQSLYDLVKPHKLILRMFEVEGNVVIFANESMVEAVGKGRGK